MAAKADATLHDLHLEGLGQLQLESGSADRVFVDYTGPAKPLSPTAACELNVGTTLRDSVCWAREGGGKRPRRTGSRSSSPAKA